LYYIINIGGYKMESKTIDHELMESLEYKGVHSGRYTCNNCVHFNGYSNDYSFCNKQGLEVLGANNICKGYEARIKNPSMPEFNFDDYLEFLRTEFYRPWTVDNSIILGSAKMGETVIDGGKR